MEKTKKEIVTMHRIASLIPLSLDGKRLRQETVSAVVLLQIELADLVQQMVDAVQKAGEKAKPEGYDSRAPKEGEAESEERAKERTGYEASLAGIESRILEEKTALSRQLLTRDEFADICGLIGVEGEISIGAETDPATGEQRDMAYPRRMLIADIGRWLVA